MPEDLPDANALASQAKESFAAVRKYFAVEVDKAEQARDRAQRRIMIAKEIMAKLDFGLDNVGLKSVVDEAIAELEEQMTIDDEGDQDDAEDDDPYEHED